MGTSSSHRNSRSGLGKNSYLGEMKQFNQFLVQEASKVYQSPFFDKFELDEYSEKAFLTSERRGQQKFPWSFPFLLSLEFQLVCLNFTFARVIAMT